MSEYFSTQLIPSLLGERSGHYIGWKRFYNLALLLKAIAPVLILSMLLSYWQARRTQTAVKTVLKTVINSRANLFYGLMMLVAFLPTLISSRQDFHYFAQAMPFAVLLFSNILSPLYVEIGHGIKTKLHKLLLSASVLVLLIAICVFAKAFATPGNRIARFDDIQAISAVTGDYATISVAANLSNQWGLAADFYRYHHIIITPRKSSLYYLQYQAVTTSPPAGYHLLPIKLREFKLYQRD